MKCSIFLLRWFFGFVVMLLIKLLSNIQANKLKQLKLLIEIICHVVGVKSREGVFFVGEVL